MASALTFLFYYVVKVDALTTAGIKSAYQIGENGDGTALTEVYNSGTNLFDYDFMNELCEKLIGNKDADIYAVEEYINAHGVTEFGSKIVKAATINGNAGNANYGIVLKLGGFSWSAAALTIDSNQNVVLTLYMAEGSGARIHPNVIDYDSSSLRSKTLSNYSFFSTGDFAAKYLVQPKDIAYQQNQRYSNGSNPTNGALSSSSKWGDDYIWIPSDKEVVAYADGGKTIWGLTTAQKGFTGADAWAWLRTKYDEGLALVGNNGSGLWGYINTSSYTPIIRPAIHLNLSEACGLRDPSTVTTVYNGNDQKVETLQKKPAWYNSNAMNISYSATPRVVGSYTGTVTLNDAYFWGDKTNGPKSFSFEITQKPIGLTEGTDPDTELPTFTVNTNDLCGSDSAPNITIRYSGNGYNDTEPPTDVGTYTATAEISDTNSNYKLDKEYAQTIIVTARKVAVPVAVGSANFAYNGKEQELALQNAGSDVKIICPDGITFADGKLKVKNAGSYTVRATLADNVNTIWGDTTGGNGSRDITVVVTKRVMNLTFGVTDNNWTWTIDDTPTVTTTDDRISGDGVEVILSYRQSGGSKVQLTSGSAGSLSATFPKLERGNYELIAELGKGGESGNYELKYTPNPRTFRITGTNASVTGVNWQYTNGDDPTIVPIDGDSTNVTYNGKKYAISIDESELTTLGVRVKPGSFVNTEKTNAGTYTVSVTLEKANENVEFQDTVFTLVLTIDKAKYDLGAVSWENTNLVYNGSSQTLDLATLPTGLVARLSGNKEMNAGKYTAQILSFTVLDNQNYIVPTKGDPDSYLGTFNDWTKDWEILKKEIELDWTSVPTTDANNQIFPIPVLQADGDKVEYVYYKSNENGDKLDIIDIDDLIKNQGAIEYYLVEAVVKTNFASNYTFSSVGDNPYLFTVGENKTLVRFEVNVKGEDKTLGGELPYKKGGYEAELKITDGALTAEDFDIVYCDSDGSVLSEIPSELGEYLVKVNLKEDKTLDYYLQEMTFGYKIVAAVIDLSDVRWGFLDKDGNKTEYTQGLIYARNEEGAITYRVQLIGVPEELASFLVYEGTYEESNVGNYSARFKVGADFDSHHYEPLSFPSAVGEIKDGIGELKWRIKELEIGLPMDGNLIFDGEGHDFAKICGLPEDWIYYFDVSIQLTRPDGTIEAYAGYDGKAYYGNDAGKYEITFKVKKGINPAAGDANVWIGEDEIATVEVEIAQRKLTVTGWRGTGTKAQAQFAEEDVLSGWYKYAVYDSEGNIAEPDAVTGKYASGTYRRTVEPTSGNVVIEFTDADCVVFTVTADGNETDADVEKIDAPTFKGGMGYTGKEFTITDENAGEYFDGWDSEKMTVVTCETGKDAGEYKVTVGLKDTLLTAWSDDETNAPKEIAWEIEKAKLTVTWENEKDPVANAGEYEGMVEFEYAYYEGDTEVPRESLEAGKSYTVKATLKEGYEKNFEFTDAEGNVLEEPTESEGYGFVKGSDSWLGQLCEKIGLPYNFPLIQVLLTCLFTLLFILFLTLWIVYAKRRRAAQAEIEEYKEIMGE